MINKKEFLKTIQIIKEKIDLKINDYFQKDRIINQSMVYASDGGKRIRACLYLESKKMFSQSLTELDYDFAMAIEFIHAYSLVHDDLPAMDNDNYRRGNESVHKKFGEDIGILTGDALLNEAAIIFFDLAEKDKSYIKAAKYVFERSSRLGMIDGQVLDLKHEKKYNLSYLLEVYAKKTSDLFRASCIGAAISANVCESDLSKIDDYAYNLGLAFQIQDDLLEEDYEDELNILNIMDRSEAVELLKNINKKAKKSIESFDDNEFLLYLVDYLSARNY